MNRLGPHTIVVRRATTAEDAYGNEIRDWGSASSTSVAGCSVQEAPGVENLANRDTVVVRKLVYAPAGTDLLATDRVEYGGHTFEVTGDPMRWDFPPIDYVEFLMRRGEDL